MPSEEHIRRMQKDAAETASRGFAKDHLRSYVERIERLNEETKSLSGDKRDVYAEAEANGFSKRAIKRVVKVRDFDREHGKEARMSEEAIFDTYMNALGLTEGGS